MKDNRLNDGEVAILCDIGSGSASPADLKGAEINELIDRGFIERDSKVPGLHLKLTAKAQETLASRGVGLNES
jgi:hypothetical protein